MASNMSKQELDELRTTAFVAALKWVSAVEKSPDTPQQYKEAARELVAEIRQALSPTRLQ
jgi:hypothetical protein